MSIKKLLAVVICAVGMAAGGAHAALVSATAGAWSVMVDEATGAVTLCSASANSCKRLANLAVTGLTGNVLISIPPGNFTWFHVANRYTRTGLSCSYAGSCSAVTFY